MTAKNKYSNGIIPLFSLAAILFLTHLTFAETATFEKEYTYQASELDSKISSRTIALEQVKILLLEELGTYLESETQVKNFKLSRDQITTLSAGIVRTEVLSENWDGKTYHLKAKIAADPQEVMKSIDSLRKDRERSKDLEAARQKAEEAFKEIERLRKEVKILNKREGKQEDYKKAIDKLIAKDWFEKGFKLLQEEAKHSVKILGYLTILETPESVNVDNLNEAINAFNKALEFDPRFGRAYRSRGGVSLLMKNYDQAARDCNQAINLDPMDAENYIFRATIYNSVNNYGEAIKDFDRAIFLDPKSSSSFYFRAGIYEKIEKYQQAIKDYERAIELAPENFEKMLIYNWRGDLYAKWGNDQKAAKDYEKAIEFAPDKAHACSQRAWAYSRIENYQQAIKFYTRAIELEPQIFSYYNNRAFAHQEMGNYPQAIQDFERAIELTPKTGEPKAIAAIYAQGHNGIGLSNEKLGKYQEAIKNYDAVLKFDPNFIWAYWRKGKCYESLGDHKRAMENYVIAARLGQKDAQEFLKARGVKW